MNIVLRKIDKKDNPILSRLIKDVFVEHSAQHHKGTIFQDPTTDALYELFLEPGSLCWIAKLDNQIVGCCGIYPTPGLPKTCVELVKFYLLAMARGKGIGKLLLQQCVRSALDMGYSALYLESLPEFKQAVGMYEKYGFKHLDRPMGNSGHYGCTIWMKKDLGTMA